MRSLPIRPLVAAVLFALVAVPAFLAGCDSAAPSADGTDFGSAGAASSTAEIIVTGAITTNTTWTSNNNYVLNGIVEVRSGAVLTIQPGTLIQGSSNQPSALLVQQGARLEANGTAASPIVFTSREPVGQRAPGDWGGVIIVGNSTCNGIDANGPGQDDCDVEGLPAPFDNLQYGGDPVNPTDNSGTLRYVRIEFAGFELTPGNEINALTLYSVGSGTTIEFVQTHKGLDDGFEFFGGTFDARYLLATGIGDDSFDFSYGYTGRLQFLIAQLDRFSGDRAFETDNNETGVGGSPDFLNEPLTKPVVYNATAIGRFPSDGDDLGLKLRRGVGGEYNNLIIGGFGTFFLDVDDQETLDNCRDGDLIIRGGVGVPLATGDGLFDPDPINELECVDVPSFSDQDPRPFPAIISRTNPDFRFRNTSLLTRPNLVQTPPNDGFFLPADYLGAVAPGISQSQAWYAGWSSYPEN
ncbi:MAG: hypothetical protein AAGI91_15590 [Bacteroidota bacterium]